MNGVLPVVSPHGSIGIALIPEWTHDRLVSLAQLVEGLGFGTLWYADERFFRDTYVGLAACALATSRLRLGPGVNDPFTRHPTSTAMAIASLQELSRGRAILGLGAGNIGFENLGLKLDRPALALRDTIAIVRGMIAGHSVTHEGAVIRIADVHMSFVPPSAVPVYLSADGPRTLQLAGEVADGVILMHCASSQLLSGKLAKVRSGAIKANREIPRVVARLDVAVSEDRDAAMRIAKARIARILWRSFPDVAYLGQHGLRLPPKLSQLLRSAGPFADGHGLDSYWQFVDHIPDEFVYPIALAGTPTEVAAQIQGVLNGEAEELMLYVLVPDGETIESCLKLIANTP